MGKEKRTIDMTMLEDALRLNLLKTMYLKGWVKLCKSCQIAKEDDIRYRNLKDALHTMGMKNKLCNGKEGGFDFNTWPPSSNPNEGHCSPTLVKVLIEEVVGCEEEKWRIDLKEMVKSFILKGYQFLALQLKGWLKSKTSMQEYSNV